MENRRYCQKLWRIWDLLFHGCWQKEKKKNETPGSEKKPLLLIAKAVVRASRLFESTPPFSPSPMGAMPRTHDGCLITEEEHGAWGKSSLL